jgi:hypothetical protein
MLCQTNTFDSSFKEFLFKSQNKKVLFIYILVAIFQFAIFKYFYPFASYIHGDSFSYLDAAYENRTINTYLIGYSKFLRLFSVFAKPDYLLVSFQYLLIHCSVLFLLFSTFYFFKITRPIKYIILICMLFNPLFWHLANLISSDGLFLSISMIWFTLLLWVIYKPSKRIIIWHAISLFLAFTVRYNSLIYPFISAGAFYLSKLSLKQKIAGIGSGAILCLLFVCFTSYQYKKLTGHWQYSPFSGWQLANNAMYTYRYVDSAKRKPVPDKFKELDNMIRDYFDSTRDRKKFYIENLQASTVYMWTPTLSLFRYREKVFSKDTAAKEFRKWASMGPIYKEYGLHIIRNYPLHFVQYFVWPNANKYYAPPVEFLQKYNSGKISVTKQAKDWFGYKSLKVSTRFKSKIVRILNFYPIFSGIINVVMLCTLLCYVILKGWNFQTRYSKGVLLAAGVWLLNAGFTILASSAALRFQSFPIMLTTIFSALLIDWMFQLMVSFKLRLPPPIEIAPDKGLTAEVMI